MDNDGDSGRTDPKEIQTGISTVLLKSKNWKASCWIGIQHQSISHMKDMVSLKYDAQILARLWFTCLRTLWRQVFLERHLVPSNKQAYQQIFAAAAFARLVRLKISQVNIKEYKMLSLKIIHSRATTKLFQKTKKLISTYAVCSCQAFPSFQETYFT